MNFFFIISRLFLNLILVSVFALANITRNFILLNFLRFIISKDYHFLKSYFCELLHAISFAISVIYSKTIILFLCQTISHQTKGLPFLLLRFITKTSSHRRKISISSKIKLEQSNKTIVPRNHSFNIASRDAKTYRDTGISSSNSSARHQRIHEFRKCVPPRIPRRSLEISADFALVTSGNGPGNITFARKRRTKRDSQEDWQDEEG